MSTDPLNGAWRLHEQVSVRPERFGALLYHFGTRRLSFVKDPRLAAVLGSIERYDDARAACFAAGAKDADLATFGAALRTLAASHMIVERGAA